MKYKLKIKSGFYCKLFNNYRYDNKCNEMSCEFCDEFYQLMEDPIINKRFGKLIVLTFYNKENNRPYYTCKCDCGNVKVIKKLDLLRGRIQSCGCLFDP